MTIPGARQLAGLAWPDVAEVGPAILAVPVGSTEQHGPHLPLSTDTDLAVALCARLSADRPEVLAGPPLWYGASGEHQGFAGTLSIGLQALECVLVELCRSAAHTFAGVVLVSTHGGNAAAVGGAERRLRQEGNPVLVWSPRWDGDVHAGRTETAIQLALSPDAVRLARAAAGDPRPLSALLPALRSGGVASVSPNGVLGDPAGATAAEGRVLVDALFDDLSGSLDRWRAA